MISDDATLEGVAPEALLYASADNGMDPDFDPASALSAQHVAVQNGGDVWATNMSFGNPIFGMNILDGNSLLTQFVDWSAREHEMLYVVAGNEGTMIPVPTDTFNGMTIAYSERVGSVWRRVGSANTFDEDAVGNRTSISLIAPGDRFPMTDLGSMTTTMPHPLGTSFAAPHVTGAVALLQEHAQTQIDNSVPGWDINAQAHQVIKAVLMNSADKIEDNGMFVPPGETEPILQGNLLGMGRTVVKADGTSTWFDSDAYNEGIDEQGGFNPLDLEMGTGHLNVGRAFTQYDAGEFNHDAADIPAIGWDFAATQGENERNTYRFDQPLDGGSFVAITLAWDREVELDMDHDSDGQFDAIDTDADGTLDLVDTFTEAIDDGINPPADNQINDLTLYLLPKESGVPAQAIAASMANEGTVEHMFFQIPETGEYEFWVFQEDEDVGAQQPYAVAWWTKTALLAEPGDFNNDGMIDGADLAQWRGDFGETTGGGSDADNDGDSDGADFLAWQRGFGTTSATPTAAAVPEPSAWMLSAFALLLVWRRAA
jgi:hypothetical protein